MKITVNSSGYTNEYSIKSHGVSIVLSSHDIEGFYISWLQSLHAGIFSLLPFDTVEHSGGLISFTNDLGIKVKDGKMVGIASGNGSIFIPFHERSARRFLETLIQHETLVRAC